jgi:hypothetical protein
VASLRRGGGALTTQDRYLGRRLNDRVTADVLEGLFESGDASVPR